MYFIFDLDETLAELYTMYYFIESLKGKEIPKSLTTSLHKAYKKFVAGILEKEVSDRPLGILRPGILGVMKKLSTLKKAGKIKGVIVYSNNSHLQSLEFIRDLIHLYIGTTLIKDCIHFNHPMRNGGNPSDTNKTWNEIKQIMIKGKCNALNIEQKSVYFFDDLNHPDLQEKLDNYYKVPSYHFKASHNRVADIYKDAICDIDMDVFKKYVMIEKVQSSKKTGRTTPPMPDKGIDMMMDAIEKVNKKTRKKSRINRT